MNRSLKKRIQWFLGGTLKRQLGLTPMHRVLAELQRRGIQLNTLDALELFGGTGEVHAMVYAPQVKSLTAWEYDKHIATVLQENVPQAQIEVVDTIQAIRTETRRFNFILSDNPPNVFGNSYCENFDLFPHLFQVVAPPAVLAINVLTHLGARERRTAPYIFTPEHLTRRREFYQTDTPDNISEAELAQTYTRLAEAHGLCVDWWFVQPRRTLTRMLFVHYLVMGVRRK